MLTILDPSTLAAVKAAATQDAQAAALVAPWAGGNVTARVMNVDTLLATLTQGPWVQDNGADPRDLTLGARLARTFVTGGTPTRVVFRSGSTDIFSLSAGVGSGDVSFAAAISSASLERIAGITITAATALPKVTYASAFAIALAASSGATDSPVSGMVAPMGGPLSAAATVTLSCGTGTFADATLDFASGATAAQAFSFTPTSDAVHAVAMSNTLALTNIGSPASYTSSTSAGLTVGAQIATLSVTSESGSGSRPYAATVLPLRGEVPSGSHVSNAAGTEAGAILSRHDDNSAAVVVFASTASATGSVALHVATGTAPAALTAAAIAAAGLSSVAVDLGAYGVASITDFSSPAVVWFATSKVYCASYRVAAPSPGSTALEAVIYVWAWADRVHVEVVVENAKLTIGALGVATPKPDAATYTAATVSINGGAAIATVNSADVPTEAAHSAFRGWYAAGWVGAGATGLRVTQLHSELQLHPLLFKCDQAATFDMAGYASDAYTPWSTGRYRPAGMGGGGDHAQIGPLPQWEARALQSGDYRAWRATEASALAFLGYACQYRDAATGDVPTLTKLKVNNVSMNGYSAGNPSHWPSQAGTTGPMSLEVAHHPAVGLMAFLSRPSPVFIELAQKLAVWNGAWTVVTGGPVTTTGVFGNAYQVRGRGWCMRSLAHATFLTPDAHPWKAPAKTSISDNVAWLDAYRTDSKALLNAVWDVAPNDLEDGYVIGPPTAGGAGAYGAAMWMQHYLVTETAKLANANLLSGSAQTALETLADWLALQPVRWVNEQPSGAWRYIPYATPIGRNAATMDSLSTYALQMDYWYDDAPPAVSGTWYSGASTSEKTYAGFVSQTAVPQDYYPMYFWSALVAAVERGVAGSATAWNTVKDSITNLSTWRAGFGSDPRWGSTPINPPGATLASDVWTPAKDGSGNITTGSWVDLSANVGRWTKVADTEINHLGTALTAIGFNPVSDDKGNGGLLATFQAWVGGALAGDTFLIPRGGGHRDSSNNGTWGLALERLGGSTTWEIVNAPSDPDDATFPWSTEYKGATFAISFTHYGPPGAPDGRVNDMLPDGKPTSMHTYNGVAYDSLRNEIITTRVSRWTYDIDANTWARSRWTISGSTVCASLLGQVDYSPANDEYFGIWNTGPWDNGPTAWWGPNSGEFGGGEYFKFYRCPASGSELIEVTAPTNWNALGGTSKVRVGDELVLFLWWHDSTERWALYDSSARTFTQGTVGSPKTYDSAHEMMAAAWAPQLGAAGQVIRYGTAGALEDTWWAFDLDTKANVTYTPAGLPPTLVYPGGKAFHYPARNCIVAIQNTSLSTDAVYLLPLA